MIDDFNVDNILTKCKHRTAFIAVYLNQIPAHRDAVASIYHWGERLATAACIARKKAGYTRGRIRPETLGEQIVRSYRTSCRAWAFRRISIREFRATALLDVYLSLAADAVETFHATLLRKTHIRRQLYHRQ